MSKLNNNEYAALIKTIESGSRKGILERLYALYEAQHGGCDDNTCSMEAAYCAGYGLIAIDQFSGCGAASNEFIKLFKQLPKHAFQLAVNHEYELFQADPECESLECEHGCGAYIYNWRFSGERVYCGNCGKITTVPVKQP